MFLWDHTNPMRDGALENDIVSHENTHGISNRMTGGGTGRSVHLTSMKSFISADGLDFTDVSRLLKLEVWVRGGPMQWPSKWF